MSEILEEEARTRIELNFENAVDEVYRHNHSIRLLVQECLDNRKHGEDDLNDREKKSLQTFANALYSISFKGSQRVRKHGIAQAFVSELERKLRIPEDIISYKKIQSSRQSVDHREKEATRYQNDSRNISITIKSFSDLVEYLKGKSTMQFLDEIGEVAKIDDIKNIIESIDEVEALPGQPVKDSFAVIVEKVKILPQDLWKKETVDETICFVYLNNKQYLFVGRFMLMESPLIADLIHRALAVVLKTSIKVDATLEKLLSFFSFRLNISARAFFKDFRKYTKNIK
uniref:HEPN_MAE_28990 domain-containing protein n=1 Tax=Strongyloides papillosus TaxID=174720 RepID=A0A0N5BUS9_STREA